MPRSSPSAPDWLIPAPAVIPIWSLLFQPSLRPDLLRSGWKDVRKVFILAVILDVIYEIIVFHWVYPVQELLVAAILALVPDVVIRGITARIASGLKK